MKTFIKQIEERRLFTKSEWNRLPDSEKETWKPSDGTYDWPEEPPEIPKEEKQDRAFQNYGKFQMENLRLKPGQVYPISGGRVEIIAWGPRVHLVSVTWNSGKETYALMPRLVEDSSFGLRDIMNEYPTLNKLPSLEAAEAAHAEANR